MDSLTRVVDLEVERVVRVSRVYSLLFHAIPARTNHMPFYARISVPKLSTRAC